MDDQQKNHVLFVQLVYMFHAAAMHQLGKIKDPLTDKIERNLEAAQSTIDLLDMIKEKTRGNLNPDEERALTSIITELKLNYVDESKKPDPEKQDKEGHTS